MKKYEIQIGNEWFKVRGYVNPKGWLEWKDNEGAQGLCKPGTFREVQRLITHKEAVELP